MLKAPFHIDRGSVPGAAPGFSLVELLIAVSVFLTFVLATSGVTMRLAHDARHVSNGETAAMMADEGLEAVRNLRDAGPDFAYLPDGTYGLSASTGQWALSGPSDTRGPFTRTVTVSTVGTDQKQADVAVRWSDATKADSAVSVSAYFTNWRAILNRGVGLTISKIVVNHGGTKTAADFGPYMVDDAVVQIGEANVFPEGRHQVSEAGDPNYTRTFSGDCDASGRADLIANTVNTCVITNEEVRPRLTVAKTVINHGLAKTAADFTLLVDGNPVTVGAANTVNSGTHTVSEVPDPQYRTFYGGDCAPDGSVTLASGVSKTCVVTNEEKQAGVTVYKAVVNHGLAKTAADFAPFKVGTTAVTLGTPTLFNSGSYVVSETTDPNYVRTFSGDCDATGKITIASGASYGCLIVNEEKRAYLTINKVVVNNVGGTKTVADFAPYKIDGVTVEPGVATAVDSGVHTVTETPATYYKTTFGGDCGPSGSVTLAPGDNKTCTITNEYIAPVGVLVYGNGGTTSDAIAYKILYANDLWSAAANAADVDPLSADRALRAVRVFSSKTRQEKVIVSRHFDGVTQYVYAQVWDGASNVWGNVRLLASWTDPNYLDVRNFDGTYLNNGNFAVVYSDNTAIPKMSVWNGSSWSAAVPLTTLGAGQIPSYITLYARPGTNEIMGVFFTQLKDSLTEYYSGSAWSAATVHSTDAASASTKMIDFAWNRKTPTVGAVVYAQNAGDKNITYKLWTANGAGGGAWSGSKNGPGLPQPVSRLRIVDRPGANEFHACAEDSTTAPKIYCERMTFSGTSMNTSKASGSPLGTTDNGVQLSFDIGFEAVSSATLVAPYSDTTATAKFKKYTASSNAYDAAATAIGALSGAMKTARVVPLGSSDDMMVLLGDANRRVYSVMWNGGSNVMYGAPAARALTSQGTNGSAAAEYWYDFAWIK